MSFTSLLFLRFFAAAVLGWYVLPVRARKPFLLLCSYYFYMYMSPVFGLLLLGGTVISYGAAMAHQKAFFGRQKLWTGLGVLYTLGVLLFYKYFDFLCGSLFSLLGLEYASLGLGLPIGISFFTFAICGYLFDIQKGKLKAEENILDHALFVAFFPCLLSGPIGRAREFLPQLKNLPRWDLTRFKRGLLRFARGAVKKMVVADLIGSMVDVVYTDPSVVSGGAALFAVLLYSFQIYFDFCGYSDMAIGIADSLGFAVPENFRAPYLSTTVKSFWKKWHMSLTGWFREYLYFPLGGSRKGAARTWINVLIVFAVSGLWHGAAVTYILWGLLNGFYQMAESWAEPVLGRLKGKLGAVLRCLLTFGLITFSWIFFRASDMAQAIYIIKHILLILRDGFGMASLLEVFPLHVLGVVALLALPWIWEDIRTAQGKPFPALEIYTFRYWGVMLALLLTLSVFGVYGEGFNPQEFVYFNF